MKKRFGEEQIIGFLKEAEGGVPVRELCRKYGFSDASFYLWRSKFGGMDVSDARRLVSCRNMPATLRQTLSFITTRPALRGPVATTLRIPRTTLVENFNVNLLPVPLKFSPSRDMAPSSRVSTVSVG